MNSSRSSCNFQDRTPAHAISNIARLTFFSSNSASTLTQKPLPARGLPAPDPPKRNSLLTGVYNLALDLTRPKEALEVAKSHYFPSDTRVHPRRSHSGTLNISFPAISTDCTPSAHAGRPPPPPPPDDSSPAALYNGEDYSAFSRGQGLARRGSFDKFSKRHYSEHSPVNIYSRGLQDLKGPKRPQLSDKSLRELLRASKAATAIREETDTLSISEDDEEEEEFDVKFQAQSYKKHLAKAAKGGDRPSTRHNVARFRVTGAGFHTDKKVKNGHKSQPFLLKALRGGA